MQQAYMYIHKIRTNTRPVIRKMHMRQHNISIGSIEMKKVTVQNNYIWIKIIPLYIENIWNGVTFQKRKTIVDLPS